jgi:hypothetical protein
MIGQATQNMLRSVIAAKTAEVTECLIKLQCGPSILILPKNRDPGRDECAKTSLDIPGCGQVRITPHGRCVSNVSDGCSDAGTDVRLKRSAWVSCNNIGTDRSDPHVNPWI